ncbi:hypothetical protein FHT72_006659 [Rhizobium sp. BK077]|nr:hypothetical protein [Rhizobium sp. BK112]MBB3372125.1 hypothetical protein [Rhizobium sp. BK077]MBB4183277.1 hypothetical protein [Rhizobium sp. BK109]
MEITDITCLDSVSYRSMTWIKTPDEAQHDGDRRRSDRVCATLDALKAEVDRLFAQNRLARRHSLFDEIGMGRRRGCDKNCVDDRARENLVDRIEDCGGEFAADFDGRRTMNIEHAGKGRTRMGRDVFGVHPAYPPAAENGDFKHQDPPNRIFAMIVA